MNELDDFIKWIGRHTSQYNLCGCGSIKKKFSKTCWNCFDQSGPKNPMWGRKFTKEHKRKISWLGRKHTEKTKGKMRMRAMGHIVSEKTRMKISKARIIAKIGMGQKRPEHSKIMSGSQNPNWRGGKSLELYGSEFKEKTKELIRRRDDYACQFCGTKENGRELPVHHIDYKKKNADPVNLITLCDPHHTESNHNRDKWQFFYETYQEIRMIQ